jgi:hypothetical protein
MFHAQGTVATIESIDKAFQPKFTYKDVSLDRTAAIPAQFG